MKQTTLKRCNWCGVVALEGEEECSKCGARDFRPYFIPRGEGR